MSGGAGPTSTQTTTNPYQANWQSLINNVTGLTSGPLPVYGGPTVAPLSQNQTTAADMAKYFATNGSPAGNAANAAIVRQAGGTSNPYGGMDPFIQGVIDPSNKLITDAYSRGTAAQTDAAAAIHGAYGGSGYNTQVGANQRSLADSLAANTSGLLSGQYNKSADLFNTDQSRQLQAAALGPGSQAADLASIGALGQTGAVQQGNTQAVMDAMKQYFGDTVSAQFTPAQMLASILGQAQGNVTTTAQGPNQSSWANILAALGLAGTAFKP